VVLGRSVGGAIGGVVITPAPAAAHC